MNNDLDKFERELLRSLNFQESKKYNYKNFMEWSTDKKIVEKNLQDGEMMYECNGFYIAIKP